jgi:hypothetical protein
MKLQTFEFSNQVDTIRIMATDAFNAWDHLTWILGFQDHNGRYLPHRYSISNVCDCGKTAGRYRFCCEECYVKFQTVPKGTLVVP